MYYNELMETYTRYERVINESMLKLESIHPRDLINDRQNILIEATIDGAKAKAALDKIIEALNNTLKKFNDLTRKLKTKNTDWEAKAESFNVNSKNLDGFEYEIFPYWTVLNLYNTPIPDVKRSMQSQLESENGKDFMTQYFSNIIDDEGNVNKNIFRGITKTSSSEKIKIDANKAKTLYPKFINLIKTAYNIRQKVSANGAKIAKTLTDANADRLVLNESTLLSLSIFKNEFYEAMLEAADDNSSNEPITTGDIEKEDKENDPNNNDKKIKVDAEQNKKTKDAKDVKELVKLWSKYCTSVVSAEMDMLDEAYDECVRIVTKIMKYKKGDKNNDTLVNEV